MSKSEFSGKYMRVVCGRIFQEGSNFAQGNCMGWMSRSPCRLQDSV